jgi:hypothetical protein
MEEQKFRFMSFKEYVPDALRFWVYIIFLIAFQFSNGMYFTAMSQMEGELSLTMNDVKMMSHAMLVGLTMYFPLAFRLKFRFTNRTCLLVASIGLALCNLVVPYIHSVPVLVAICYAAGFLRLFGTFECFSSILPKIAPTHNYAVFLSFVFFIVLGVINVFDIASTYMIYYYHWHYVHYAAIGLLLVVALLAFTVMRPFRFMPKMPLYGIDFPGMLLWSVFILSLIFVAQYGNQLDWLHSRYIRIALGVSLVAAGLNLWRMMNIRHPFLEAAAFATKNLPSLLILFLLMGILLAAKNTLQNTFMGGILHYDQLNMASLKWFEFAGMGVGAVFSWFALTRLKWAHKTVTFCGMSAIVIYTVLMYFLASAQVNIGKFYLPLACCGFGQICVFIALTVYAQATAPFKNYFQVLGILGLIRTGIASPIGDAVYTHFMRGLLSKNTDAVGSGIDYDIQLNTLSNGAIYSGGFVTAVQELFGWSVLFGCIILIAIASSRFRKGVKKPIPSLFGLYRVIMKN